MFSAALVLRAPCFKRCYPLFSGLQIVFVEPDVEAVPAEYLHELARCLHVHAGVTKEYVACSGTFIPGRAH
jgi:hypothetical protein